MPRYEWRAFVYISADDEQSARDAVEDTLDAVNKNPDGPHMSLDDSGPDVDEDEED